MGWSDGFRMMDNLLYREQPQISIQGVTLTDHPNLALSFTSSLRKLDTALSSNSFPYLETRDCHTSIARLP